MTKNKEFSFKNEKLLDVFDELRNCLMEEPISHERDLTLDLLNLSINFYISYLLNKKSIRPVDKPNKTA